MRPSDDDDYTFRYYQYDCELQTLFLINTSGTPLQIMADSGASVNVLIEKDYHTVKDKPQLRLHSPAAEARKSGRYQGRAC
jgi:hypothetical protein